MNRSNLDVRAAAVPLGLPGVAGGSWLRVVQVLLVLTVACSIPGGVVAAFGFGADRNATGDSVALVFFGSFVLLLSTPWWRTEQQRSRSADQRLQSMCMIWFGLTFTTHLSWELFWLLLHERIIASPHEPWAFMWWMYIDGGDQRYATASPVLLTIETLAVINGAIGVAALWLRRRSQAKSSLATLMLMATGVVHVYSALLYLLTEAFGGYPNVDTRSVVDFWIKFWLLNGIWVVMPWAVFRWGMRTLTAQLRAA